MKNECLSRMMIFVLVWMALISSAWSGQVVTQDAKLWAKKALAEEKTLRTIAGKNTVAVLYFQNRTGQTSLDPLQKGMALMLITDISKVQGIQVVERIKLQALMDEMALGVSGLVEANTAPRVGKLLGAQWIVGGSILEGKMNQLRFQSHPLEVPTQKILGQPTAEGPFVELFRVEKELLMEIIKLLKIELKPAEEVELRKPCSKNPRALTAFFKAIEASDREDYKAAGEFYQKALKEDPGICGAGEGLRELQTLGLFAGQKKSQEMLHSLKDRTSLTDQLSPEDSVKRVKKPKDIPSPVRIDLNFP